ncbi:hypothetical protein ABFV58_25430 [Pseudomonas protegens]|uniref:hypothetical protein n=1 Tax=Pseudomonas protegens TaxID=380021 RepID=UPI0034D55D76
MPLPTSSQAALPHLSIEALLQGFATLQFTPVDVLQAVLAQIERHEPQLNALCERQDPASLRAAQASTARWPPGNPWAGWMAFRSWSRTTTTYRAGRPAVVPEPWPTARP